MRFPRAGLASVLAFAMIATCAVWAAPSSGATYTLRAAHHQVTDVGPWELHYGRRNRTVGLGDAIRALGQPTSTRVVDYYCRVTWRRFRIVARFTTLGGVPPGETMCSPGVGLIDQVVMRGRRWRTWQGLRIGARSSAVRQHHHRAQFERGAWTLAHWINPGFGDVPPGTPEPLVVASVREGRISALRAFIGAQGE